MLNNAFLRSLHLMAFIVLHRICILLSQFRKQRSFCYIKRKNNYGCPSFFRIACYLCTYNSIINTD